MGEQDHKSEQSPLGQLDSLLGTVAGVVGADPPAGVAANLSETDREAIESCLRLVGAAGLDHTLTRNGEVIVPVDDGSRTLVLEPRKLNGQEWINIWIPLLELPTASEIGEKLSAFLAESNRYYGAKFLHDGAGIVVMLDIPREGLTTPTLVAAMERVAWVAEDVQADLHNLGAGHPPEGVWQALGYPVTRPLKTPPTLER